MIQITMTEITASVTRSDVTVSADKSRSSIGQSTLAMSSPERDIDRGWAWVVMVASFFNLILLGIPVFGAGIIYVILLDALGGSPVKTALIGSMSGSLSAIAGPVAGLLTSVTSCRFTIMLGGVFCLVGFSASSFVNDLDWLLVTFGAIGGTGIGLMYTPCMVVLGYYFDVKRDIACGVAVTGAAVGSVISPLLLQPIAEHFGWRGMLLLIGAIEFHMALFGALSRPSSVEREQNRAKPDDATVTRLPFRTRCRVHLRLLRNSAYMMFNLSIFLWGVSCSAIILHLPKFALENGAQPNETKFLLLVFGASSIIARLLSGICANMGESYKYLLYFGAFGVLSFIVIAFPHFGHTRGGRLTFNALFGFYSNVVFAVLNPITVELVGLSDLAMAFGLSCFINGIGYLVGPPLVAYMLASTKSYTVVFVFSGIAMMLSAFFGLTMVLFRRPHATIASQTNVTSGKLRMLTSNPGIVCASAETFSHMRSYVSMTTSSQPEIRDIHRRKKKRSSNLLKNHSECKTPEESYLQVPLT